MEDKYIVMEDKYIIIGGEITDYDDLSINDVDGDEVYNAVTIYSDVNEELSDYIQKNCQVVCRTTIAHEVILTPEQQRYIEEFKQKM